MAASCGFVAPTDKCFFPSSRLGPDQLPLSMEVFRSRAWGLAAAKPWRMGMLSYNVHICVYIQTCSKQTWVDFILWNCMRQHVYDRGLDEDCAVPWCSCYPCKTTWQPTSRRKLCNAATILPLLLLNKSSVRVSRVRARRARDAWVACTWLRPQPTAHSPHARRAALSSGLTSD